MAPETSICGPGQKHGKSGLCEWPLRLVNHKKNWPARTAPETSKHRKSGQCEWPLRLVNTENLASVNGP